MEEYQKAFVKEEEFEQRPEETKARSIRGDLHF